MKTLPIDVAINNGEYDEIYADGVCVATPTGSRKIFWRLNQT